MRPPASYAFALAVGRGASARDRRPSLRRSRTDGNRLSRPATARQSASPSLGTSGQPGAPTGNVAPSASSLHRKGASDLKADIGEVEGRARATSTPNGNAPAPAGA